MLISLPIQINDKIINRTFQVVQQNDTIVVKLYNSLPYKKYPIKFYKVIVFSKSYGVQLIPIQFPLIFNIVNNYLVSDIFLIISTLSSSNDFFTQLLDFINSFINKSINKYIYFNSLQVNTIINTIKLNNSIDDTEYSNVENLINRIYYRTNRYLNFCLSIMTSTDNYSISNNSKILQIINGIKQLTINFYGNKMSVDEHLQHIKNPNLIKRNKNYFFSNKQKLVKLSIVNIKDNKIDVNTSNNIDILETITIDRNKYSIYCYPPKFSKYITVVNLINQLIYSEYNIMLNLVASIIYKKNPSIVKFINSTITNKYKLDTMILLKDIKANIKNIEPYLLDYMEPIPNDISFNRFVEIIDCTVEDCTIEDCTIEDCNIVLEKLFKNYTYPLNYDKHSFTLNFAKILYYSFKYIDIITDDNFVNFSYINIKIKSSYLYILKLYKMIKNSNYTLFYNSRTYTDTNIYIIVKILLYNDTFNLFSGISNDTKIIISNIFLENIILLQILSNITWKNISKQLQYFKYIVSIKNKSDNMLIVDGKINRNIVSHTMDVRLKKIILDPLSMYSFLKKETDYYKWTINFKEIVSKIFYNPIILKSNDYKVISQILFIISKVTIQSTDDIQYNKLIELLKKNTHIILFNDRINMKIKDVFKNNNLNFGYLAKHINDDMNSSITITDETDSNDIMTSKINKLTKKYYKYKGKYLEMKTSEAMSNMI